MAEEQKAADPGAAKAASAESDHAEKLTVKNNVSWASDKFSYAPGDEIELDWDIAHARAALGLVSYLTKEDRKSAPKDPKFAAPHPKEEAARAAEKAALEAREAKARRAKAA